MKGVLDFDPTEVLAQALDSLMEPGFPLPDRNLAIANLREVARWLEGGGIPPNVPAVARRLCELGVERNYENS